MLTVLLILTTLTGPNADDPANPRVFGGKLAKPGQFPYAASLKESGRHICGGSIISRRWILTAAHCLKGKGDLQILLGTTSQTEGGTEYRGIKRIVHEEHNTTNHDNDIGLLKTDRVIKFDRFTQPITIGSVRESTKVLAIGWGLTEELKYSENLKYIESEVMIEEKCKAAGRKFNVVVGPTHVCIGGVLGEGVCFADSGGPLVADGKVVGLACYVMIACAKREPDVFTRTASFSSWINKHAAECTKV